MSEAEMEQETSPAEEEIKPIAGIGTLVFGKWDASQVTCKDPGLAPYINLTTVGYSHRWQTRQRMVWQSKALSRREIHQQTNANWSIHR